MLIQTEPGFTWFYSCKKTPCVQCPTPRPSIDFSACEPLPQSISGGPLLHSKVLSLKGPKQECLCDFQKPPLLSFLSSLLPPLFCSVLSFYTADKICFPIRVITNYWQQNVASKLHSWTQITPKFVPYTPPPLYFSFPSPYSLENNQYSIYLWPAIFIILPTL